MKSVTPPKKILIIRYSSIGDIVLTTPVIRCLKQQLPDAEIHYVTKEQYAPIIESNPNVARVHRFKSNFGELIPLLKKERFDYIVDLHKNIRSFRLRMMLMRPSGSFPKLNFRKWMLVRFRINRLPDVHIVDRYFRSVASLGIMNDGLGLDYFIPQNDEVSVGRFLNGKNTGYIAMAIGARHETKIFPAEKAAEVCRKAGKPVILLGGPGDAERGNLIRKLSGDTVINTCGQLSVSQSASVIRQSDALITNDTGMMHIGAAFKKKIISLWGNTVPGFGMYPYLPRGLEHLSRIMEVKGLDCRPCSKLGFKECPKGHFKCMRMISISEIVEAL